MKPATAIILAAGVLLVIYLYNSAKPAAASNNNAGSFQPPTDTSVLDHETWMALLGTDYNTDD